MKSTHLILPTAAASIGILVGASFRIGDNDVVAQDPKVASTKTDESLRFESINASIPNVKQNPNRMFRAKIPGGWLVMFGGLRMDVPAEGITFVPDQGHDWDGHSIP